MPDTTDVYDLVYPLGTEPANGAGDIKALAESVEEALEGLGTWETYTPSWTAASTNPAIGNGTISGEHCTNADTVAVNIEITMGSTTTYGTGGVYNISLPVAAKHRTMILGVLRDASVSASYLAFLEVAAGSSTGTIRLTSGVSPVTLTTVSDTSPVTWATGDIFAFNGVYQAA